MSFPVFVVVKINSCFLIRHLCSLSPTVHLLQDQFKVADEGVLEDGDENWEEAEEEVNVQGGEVVDLGQVLVAAGDQRHHRQHHRDAQAHLGVGVWGKVERQEGDDHHEEGGNVVAGKVEEERPTDQHVHYQHRVEPVGGRVAAAETVQGVPRQSYLFICPKTRFGSSSCCSALHRPLVLDPFAVLA